MVESDESEEEGDRPIEQEGGEAGKTTRNKPWKPKVENLNMQIINENNFIQLNKFYSMYSNMDKIKLENAVEYSSKEYDIEE